jgi:hypothetical protein
MKLRIIILFSIVLFTLTGNVIAQNSKDSCSMPSLPVIEFKKTVFLSASNIQKLDAIVKIANKFPTCKLKVTGYGSSTYKAQSISWDRVYSVVQHFIKRGFNKDNIIFEYGVQGGDPNNVDLMGTLEDGPSITPVPLPCKTQHKPFRKKCK